MRGSACMGREDGVRRVVGVGGEVDEIPRKEPYISVEVVSDSMRASER